VRLGGESCRVIEGKLSCDGEKAAEKFLPRDNLLSLSLSFYIKQIFTGVSSKGGGDCFLVSMGRDHLLER